MSEQAHRPDWGEPYTTCHCGNLVVYHVRDRAPAWTRGLCQHCDEVRCDAFPGECR